MVDMKKHAAVDRSRSAIAGLNSDAQAVADSHSDHIEAVAAEARCMADLYCCPDQMSALHSQTSRPA